MSRHDTTFRFSLSALRAPHLIRKIRRTQAWLLPSVLRWSPLPLQTTTRRPEAMQATRSTYPKCVGERRRQEVQRVGSWRELDWSVCEK